MSEQAELNLTPPTSVVRNTVGKSKEQTSKNSDRPVSDATLREYCDKYYHQLLPIIAEKVHQEKVQQEKLKEVKARLNFEGCSGRNSRIQEVSQHFVSRTPNVRGKHQRGRRSSFRDGLRAMSHLPIFTDSIIPILVLSSLAEWWGDFDVMIGIESLDRIASILRHGELITIFSVVVKPTLSELSAYGYPVQGSVMLYPGFCCSESEVKTRLKLRGQASSEEVWRAQRSWLT
nr:reverse transcriptase domain-containing protein [Tanacetum cinerariifolium]